MAASEKGVAVLMLGEGLDRQGGVVAVEKLILDHAPKWIRFAHIATLEDGSSAAKILLFAKAVARLIRQLLVDRTRLVHIHVSTGGSVYRQTLTAFIALAFRRRVIMHAHSGQFPTFFEGQSGPARAVIGWVFRRCDRLLAVSDHWRGFYSDALGIDPARIVVLPNPVVVPARSPARSSKPPVELVFFGQIRGAKGVYDLLEAAAVVARLSDGGFHLTIAGDGELDQARAAARDLDVASIVTFPGWVDAKERDALMAKADVFMLPSHFEGLPMALLEAMSWGLPSITTTVGGIPDIIENEVNGLLVTPGDVEALAAAMERLIGDTEFRARLGQAARRRIEPFDIKPYVGKLAAIYRELDSGITGRASKAGPIQKSANSMF